jgi:hypothetical protein
MKSFDGYLNQDEFRSAILLGYWDRHTDAEKIYTDETKTFKKLRWGDNGDTDVVCDRINSANNPKVVQSGISIENQGKQKFFFRRR